MTWWFLSVLALVLGVPLSWWMFYKSVFSSAQTDGATYSYLRTFILIMLHMAWCVWMVLALPNLGSFSGGEHVGNGFLVDLNGRREKPHSWCLSMQGQQQAGQQPQ
jgi:hypothetical protein